MGRSFHVKSTALMLAAGLSISGSARAQQTPAATAAPSTATRANGRIGYGVEAPKADAPPAPASQPRVGTPPVYYYYTNDGYVVAPTYLVLDDGSVLVNFGNGYERVLRACASLRQAPASVARDQFGRDALGNQPDPPGIAAMKAGSRGHASGLAPTRDVVACYNAEGQGRISVTSP